MPLLPAIFQTLISAHKAYSSTDKILQVVIKLLCYVSAVITISYQALSTVSSFISNDIIAMRQRSSLALDLPQKECHDSGIRCECARARVCERSLHQLVRALGL